MRFSSIITDQRTSGQVRRWHTWPVLREQNLAEHQWQVCRLLVTLWPEAPAHAITYALLHDAREFGSGDMPNFVKAQVPDAKRVMDELEDRAGEMMGLELPVIDELWSSRIKMCDLIEMLEFATDEYLMGNRFIICSLVVVGESLRTHLPRMSEQDRRRVAICIDTRLMRLDVRASYTNIMEGDTSGL